jgi:hypothetical protein
MTSFIERLMQPDDGEIPWQALALCYDDLRFTSEKPSFPVLQELASICRRCEVLAECSEFHDYPDVIGVFAAGTWREEPDTGDTR